MYKMSVCQAQGSAPPCHRTSHGATSIKIALEPSQHHYLPLTPMPEQPDDNVLPPPAYNVTSAESQPADPEVQDNVLPDYTPPTQFTIGSSKTTAPLVSIPQIKGHLALLHAFAELRKRVESTEFSLFNIPKEADRKWAWFVALAVERCIIFLL